MADKVADKVVGEMTDEGVPDAVVDTGALPATQPHPAPTFDTGAHALPEAVPVIAAAFPDQNQSLRWWKLVLVFLAVWIPAAGVGLGLFYWWFQLPHKTPAVFVVLVYVVVCTVAGLMLSMVRDNPLVSALSMAVMSAVFASMVAAAPLYGHYYCQVKGPCVAGVIPY